MRISKLLALMIMFSMLFTFSYVPNIVEGATQDNNVEWLGVHFDSRDSYYRSPLGSYYKIGSVMGDLVHPNENVTFRIRVYENDVTAVKLRIWKSYAASEQVFDMTKESSDGTYEWWKGTIPAPNTVENYWYHFRIIDGTDEDYYADDSARDGGVGQVYNLESDAQANDYVLAYRQAAKDVQAGVVYQIITDRFYDGDPTNNDPQESSGLYDSNRENGNWRLYWGGDLAGIENKISYLKELGSTTIWISPPVNNRNLVAYSDNVPNAPYHGYEARDFKQIEEHFGTWEVFNNLVSASNAAGITVMIDFCPNHTNVENQAENGALYDNGTFVTDWPTDNLTATTNPLSQSRENIFHHNGDIYDWSDRWEVRYKALWSLADLNQHNTWVDSYLKDSIKLFLDHGIGGIRIDGSAKHVEPGWLKTFVDNVYAENDVYVIGEWYLSFEDGMYYDLAKFDNNDGVHSINIPLHKVIRGVFAEDTKTMVDLNSALGKQSNDFRWQQKMLNFVDSHDPPRFLSVNGSKARFHQALAFVLTAPGVPCIYYGNEQYLHDNTVNEAGQKGGDPYNRPMMYTWDTDTTAFKLIRRLSTLRKDNPALRYGLTRQRWLNSDVYVYERKFFNDVVLVAINRSTSTSYTLTGLYTALPSGTYPDYLQGLLGGSSITVSTTWSDTEQGYLVDPAPSLDPGDVAVWHYIAPEAGPQVGAIDPTIGRAGNTVFISGKGFGTATGSVILTNDTNSWSATILEWSRDRVKFQVPSGVTPASGKQHVDVYITAAGENSNRIMFAILSGRQIPVLFEVENTQGTVLETTTGEFLWLTGSVSELSNWSSRTENAVGPMECPAWPDWFTCASVPAGTYLEFKFLKGTLGGAGTWEGGTNHSYTVPENGVGEVTVAANP